MNPAPQLGTFPKRCRSRSPDRENREKQPPVLIDELSKDDDERRTDTLRTCFPSQTETALDGVARISDDVREGYIYSPCNEPSPDGSCSSSLRRSRSVHDGQSTSPSRDVWCGLPSYVRFFYVHQRGMTKPYAWQQEVLSHPLHMREGCNFLYSQPTSGGKSFVADIALLRCLLVRRRCGLLIVPYVSLVEEKVSTFSALFRGAQWHSDGCSQHMDDFWGQTIPSVECYAGTEGVIPPAVMCWEDGCTGTPHPSGFSEMKTSGGFLQQALVQKKGRLQRPVLYVCTIEKASALINSLFRETVNMPQWECTVPMDGNRSTKERVPRIFELGCVVIDELHMVGDGSARASILETTLAKLNSFHARHIQLIGMSATVPNLPHLAQWLRATHYEGKDRPTPLHAYVVPVGGVRTSQQAVYSVPDGGTSHAIEEPPSLAQAHRFLSCEAGTSASNILNVTWALVREVYDEGLGCLVFCPTKAKCVEMARYLYQCTRGRCGATDASSAGEDAVQYLSDHVHAVDARLIEFASMRISYHHSGLLKEERESVEALFRHRTLRVLCCTSTLAAGINLPARRVIIYTPYVAGRTQWISKGQYMQMSGRAGRAGLDPYGESYLVVHEADFVRTLAFLQTPLTPLRSSITLDDPDCVLSRYLLDCAAIGMADRFDSLVECVRYLLVAHEHSSHQVEQLALLALNLLIANDLLCSEGPTDSTTLCVQDSLRIGGMCEESLPRAGSLFLGDTLPINMKRLQCTTLGYSICASNLPLPDALLMYHDLRNALHRSGLFLAGDLHLCYLLTPVRDLLNPNWAVYHKRVHALGEDENRIAHAVGVKQALLHQAATMGPSAIPGAASVHQWLMNKDGPQTSTTFDERHQWHVLRRFFSSLVLYEILNEVPVEDVALRFQIPRGQLQNFARTASYFASCMVSFCQSMQWFTLEVLFTSFVRRVGYGVKPDLVPLMELPGVQAPRARLLFLAGYRTLEAIAQCEPAKLVESVHQAAQNQADFLLRRSVLEAPPVTERPTGTRRNPKKSPCPRAQAAQRLLLSIRFFRVEFARKLIQNAREMVESGSRRR